MSDTPENEAAQKEKGAFSAVLWWKTDPEEIERQVLQYDELKVWQSTRGISLLLCLFSVLITVAIGGFIGLSGGVIASEAVMWTVIGLLMFRGHKSAFVVAMVLWTLEKGVLVFDTAAVGGMPFLQILWWALYMQVFMQGYRVEKARRLKAPATVAPLA